MDDRVNERPKSVGISLGDGCNNNLISVGRISGFDEAIKIEGGDRGAFNNRVSAGVIHGHHPEPPAANPVPLREPEKIATAEPWYKQIGIQVAAGLIVTCLIAVSAWMELPTLLIRFFSNH